MDKVKILQRELESLGQYYRNDWSDFDGRTLRSQIEDIFVWFNSEDSSEFRTYTEMLGRQDY